MDLNSYALYLITNRDYTEFNFRKKLKEKSYEKKWDVELIEGIIEKYKDYGYIDDTRVGHNLLLGYINSKNKSKKEVCEKLYSKGLKKELVQELMYEFTDELELENLKRNLEKDSKVKDMVARGNHEEINEEASILMKKIINKYQRKGFSFGDIKNILGDILKNY